MGKQQKEYYHDPYGCTASIRQRQDGQWQLRICTPTGVLFHNKTYPTHHGAKTALGRMSEGMMERRV